MVFEEDANPKCCCPGTMHPTEAVVNSCAKWPLNRGALLCFVFSTRESNSYRLLECDAAICTEAPVLSENAINIPSAATKELLETVSLKKIIIWLGLCLAEPSAHCVALGQSGDLLVS